jgi:hypothetical protein
VILFATAKWDGFLIWGDGFLKWDLEGRFRSGGAAIAGAGLRPRVCCLQGGCAGRRTVADEVIMFSRANAITDLWRLLTKPVIN